MNRVHLADKLENFDISISAAVRSIQIILFRRANPSQVFAFNSAFESLSFKYICVIPPPLCVPIQTLSLCNH